MTREQFALLIHWDRVIWSMGILNVFAMMPQLWTLNWTHETKGLNIWVYWIYFVIQVAFSLEGHFKRNNVLKVCLGLSALVSITLILNIYYFRWCV